MKAIVIIATLFGAVLGGIYAAPFYSTVTVGVPAIR